MKNLKVKYKISIIFFIIIISIFILNLLLNIIFYQPFYHYETNKNVYAILTQFLCPEVNYFYISKPNYPIFTISDQHYYIKEINTDIAQTNIIKSYFGKQKTNILSSYINEQSYYTNKQANNSMFPSVSSNCMYKVTFGCNSINYNEFIRFYRSNFSYDNYLDSSLNWIAIKTSDNKNDYTIGVPGLASSIIMNKLPNTSIKRANTDIESEQNEYLINCLNYLNQNIKNTQISIKSGAYGNISIDIQNRLSYVKENGLNVIGFYAILDYNSIKKIEYNEDYYILNIEEIY